jgi:hypothetical protein
MLRRGIHISPSFQLSKLLSSSVRNQRVLALRTGFIRYRVPVIRGIVIPIRSRSGLLSDIEYGPNGGCEDEAFEGGIFPGGLEDGERSGDGGIDHGFGEGGTCWGLVW